MAYGGGYPSYPGYPTPDGGGYPSYPSYPTPDNQPGYPQGGYPQSNYPQQDYSQGGYPQPPPAGFAPQGYPSYPVFSGQPGGYPAPMPAGYPAYPEYPAQTPQGGGSFPGYPGYPVAEPEPKALEELPEDYQSSVAFLQETNQEVLNDGGRKAFHNLAGADGEIDAFELQDILNTVFKQVFDFDGFSIDMTRSMVAMRDYDMSGKLDFEDFKLLWSDLTICKKAFQELDTDHNGYFDKNEFAQAFKVMGLHVSDQTQRAMAMRYSDRNGHVRFDDFVAAYMRLKTMLKTFITKDYYQQGNVEFEIDEYIQMCMYS